MSALLFVANSPKSFFYWAEYFVEFKTTKCLEENNLFVVYVQLQAILQMHFRLKPFK